MKLLIKYIKTWLKVTKLLYKKWCIDDDLNMYPNLDKYRGKKNYHLREKVKAWRLKKKELETELKELV